MKRTIPALLCALVLLFSCLPAALAGEAEEVREGDGFRYVLDGNQAIILEYISTAESRRQPDAPIKNVVFNNRIEHRYPIADFRQNPFYVAEDDLTLPCAPGVMPGHKTLAITDGVLFVTGTHKLVAYPVFLAPETYEVPADTLILGAYAFACNPNLQTAVLPEGLTAIEAGAFRNCAALASVNIPATAETIAEDAFAGCPGVILTVTAGTPGEAFAVAQRLLYRYAE